MALVYNEGFNINSDQPIDLRLIVDRVDGPTASLVSLTPQYNFRNMIVWVREEKAFYYLVDSPDDPLNPGVISSDWQLWSAGGGTFSCTKSGYISGEAFDYNNQVSTASVVFNTPYTSASYSVAITGWSTSLEDPEQYIYTIYDIQPTGFLIQILSETPIGATAMWITNCWEGSNDIGGGGGGPAASVEIDLEEIAFGTGTGITSSSLFTYDPELQNLKSGYHKFLSDPRNSVIIGGTGSEIKYDINNVIVGGHVNCIYNSTSNVIIGGIGNCSNYVAYGSIISSKDSNIYQSSNFSSIINSRKGCIASYGQNLNYNTIIGSTGSFVIASRSSSVINSRNSRIDEALYSSILDSNNSCICQSLRSQILSGNFNRIYNSEDVFLIGSRAICVKGCNELITDINGFSNCFYGSLGNNTNAISLGSNLIMMTSSGRAASIVSCSSDFCSADNSLIASSCKSTLTSTYRSSIISSRCVEISSNRDSSIISSIGSKIIGNCQNTIISSTGSCIVSYTGFFGTTNLSNSVIIGGSGHRICGAKNSAIIGGVNRTLCRPAVNAPGVNEGFDNAVALPSIMGCASLALGIATSSTDGIILDDNYFTLIAYPPEPSGTMNVCLPQVGSYIIGRIYVIKKNGSGTQSTVNVCPYGSNCIDGYAGYVELVNPWDYYMLQADGVDNWIKLGGAVGLNL
jgi:hypothetical protein